MIAITTEEIALRNGRVKPKLKAVASKPVTPHFRLERIEPDHRLVPVWEFVRLGIEEVMARSRGLYPHRPEDVYMMLRLRKADLYMAYVDGDLKGFGILQIINDPFGNRPPYLLSWIGYSASHDAVVGYFKELEAIALAHKIREIRHYSTRKGWLMRPPGPGWETLTAQGWVANLTREHIKGLWMAPEITQRKMVSNG